MSRFRSFGTTPVKVVGEGILSSSGSQQVRVTNALYVVPPPTVNVVSEDGRVSQVISSPAYTTPPYKRLPTWAKVLVVAAGASVAGYIGFRATRR